MKKLSIFIAFVLILSLFLMSGCKTTKFNNAGNLTSLSYYVDNNVLDVTDQPYSDWYDCDFQFEAFLDKRVPGQVIISLRIDRAMDPSLIYVVQGDEQNLADIKAILYEYKMYKWTDSGSTFFSSASGKAAYDITATMENASFSTWVLIEIPRKYVEGLEVLSTYLFQCIETLPPYKIAEEDIPLMLHVMLPENDELFIYDERRRLTLEPFDTLDEAQKESLNKLFSRLINLYNNNIQNVYYTLDRNTDVWAYVVVGNDDPDTEPIDKEIWYAFQSPIFSPDDFDSFAEIIIELQDSSM